MQKKNNIDMEKLFELGVIDGFTLEKNKPDMYLVVAGSTVEEVYSLNEARHIIQELIDEGLSCADECTVYGIFKDSIFTVTNKIKFHKSEE